MGCRSKLPHRKGFESKVNCLLIRHLPELDFLPLLVTVSFCSQSITIRNPLTAQYPGTNLCSGFDLWRVELGRKGACRAATTPGNFPGHTLLKVTHRRKTVPRRWDYFYCLHVVWPMGKVLPPIFSSFGGSTGWEFPSLTSLPGLDRSRPDLCEWWHWWDNHWSCFYQVMLKISRSLFYMLPCLLN